MIDSQKIFGNYFDDVHITPTRLANFATNSLNHFVSANGSGEYTTLINLLGDPLSNLKAELGDVDTSVTLQKGTTLTNDQVMQAFKSTMSSEEPFIARAVGGKESAVYLQFYPQGVSEYANATKTNMDTLTHRINTAATANSDALGMALTATLQSFEENWKDSRDTQQQQMGNVEDNRTQRTGARTEVEMVLLTCIHTIAAKFPGDVEQCSSFFDLTLLLPQTRHRHQTLEGILTAGQVTTIIDRTFTDTTNLTIRNPDDNAVIAIWLAPDGEDGTPPAEALQLQPGHAANVKPSNLGPLVNPFLQVKNLSEVNEGAYEVVIA